MPVVEMDCNCNWNSSLNTSGSQYGAGWLFSTSQFRNNCPPGSDLGGTWSATTPPTDGCKTGVLWPYCRNMAIYHCPTDDPGLWTGTEFMTSYLMNGAQCGFGRTEPMPNGQPTPGLKIGQFVPPNGPGDAVLFWECMEQRIDGVQKTNAVWNDGSSSPSEEVMSDRHFTGANIACIDGHVEWWDQSAWTHWLSMYPGRLWCDPLTANGQ